jgi:hypothetical protein
VASNFQYLLAIEDRDAPIGRSAWIDGSFMKPPSSANARIVAASQVAATMARFRFWRNHGTAAAAELT